MVRVAVVGCGRQGTFHLEALAAMGDVEIAAVVDASGERVEQAGERFGVPPGARLRSHRELSQVAELGLVTVCTMPPTHCEIVLAALAAGANVLCEKPLALSAEEVQRMLDAAERAGRFVTGGFNMRWMGSARLLRELVESGAIGRPFALRVTGLDVGIPWWGPHYVRELAGGGVIAADAGHVLDLALWVAGSPRPLTVSAATRQLFPLKRAETAPSRDAAERFDVEDAAGGFVRLEGGAWMTLEMAWCADLPEAVFGFELQGERGSLRFDPLRVMLEQDGRPVDVTPAGADVDWDASVARGVRGVVEAVRDGAAPLVTPAQMLSVQRLLDGLYASAAAGREIALS